METNNLIKSIIGVLVITIIVVSVAVPIIGNVSFTEEKTINESTRYYSPFGSDADIVIQKASADDPYTINGYEYVRSIDNTANLLVSDRLCVEANGASFRIHYYGQDYSNGGNIYGYGTITISGGVATGTGDFSFTTPVSKGYVLDPDGKYVNETDFNVIPGAGVEGYLMYNKVWGIMSLNPSTSGFTISAIEGVYKENGNFGDDDETLTIEDVTINWGNTTITENGDMLLVHESPQEIDAPGITAPNATLPLFTLGIMMEGDENYSSLESVIHVVPLIMVVGVVVATVGVFLVRYRT